jgi:hypothetical protein
MLSLGEKIGFEYGLKEKGKLGILGVGEQRTETDAWVATELF